MEEVYVLGNVISIKLKSAPCCISFSRIVKNAVSQGWDMIFFQLPKWGTPKKKLLRDGPAATEVHRGDPGHMQGSL